MRTFLVALSFLTILPVRVNITTEAEMGNSTAAFPAVGLFKGLILLAIVWWFKGELSSEIMSLVVVVIYAIITGALHLDGLSDTFDGIAVRGSREKKLKVLKEPSAGPVGVTAIVLTLLAKVFFIKRVIISAEYSGILLFPVSGAMAMSLGCYFFRAARVDGLGSIFINHTRGRSFLVASAMTVAILLATAVVFVGSSRAIFAMAVSLGYAWSFGRFLQVQFGGHTGDTLGALSETTELVFLFFHALI